MPSISRYKRHSDSLRSATNLSHAGPSPRRVHPQYHLLGWFSLLIKEMSRTLSYKYSSKQGWVRIQFTCPKVDTKTWKVNIWALDLVPQSADLSWPQERPQVRCFNHKKWEEILSVDWGQPARKSLSSKEVKRKDREVTCMCSFTTGKLGKTTEILAIDIMTSAKEAKRPHEALDSDLASNT